MRFEKQDNDTQIGGDDYGDESGVFAGHGGTCEKTGDAQEGEELRGGGLLRTEQGREEDGDEGGKEVGGERPFNTREGGETIDPRGGEVDEGGDPADSGGKPTFAGEVEAPSGEGS